MRLKDLGVRHKLVVFAMVISSAAVALASLIDFWADTRAAEHTVRARLRAHAEVLAVTLAPALANANQASISRTVAGLSALPDIDRAVVTDLGGRVVAEYRRDPDVNDSDPRPLSLRRAIVGDSQVLGRIELATARRAMHALILDSTRVTLSALAVCMLVAWLLATRLQRLISQPVLRIADVARRVSAERDYGLRVEYDAHDEVGQLSDAFNTMLDQVQRRDRELEHQVRERTEELVRLNERLKHQAYHDALTKLPNRALFDDRLTLALAQAERDASKVAVLFLDLDDFKRINDSLGHDYGDELLRQVALRIRNAVRRIDTVARLGGDEFTVVLSKLDSAEDAAIVARAIIETLRKPFEIGAETLRTSTSIGIAVYPDHGRTVTALKRNADTAMYSAKRRGRDGFQFYSDALDTVRGERLVMLSDLVGAAERDELDLVYQPVLDVVKDRLVGVEALVRWRHPLHGPLSPGQFLGYAEGAGVIEGIDRWVIEHGLTQLRRLESLGDPPLTMSFNLSLASLRAEDAVGQLHALCARFYVSATQLAFELNERALIRASESDLTLLRQLRGAGFRVYIDDFGSGYSALTYLPQCPVDAVKIERAFIRDLANDRYGAAAVRAMAAMARALDLGVVAKGTEDWSQQNALLSIGIVQMQGYALGPPMTVDEFERWVRARTVQAQAS